MSEISKPTPQSFDAQLDALLAGSREQRRGLVFHVNGQRLAGIVKEILSDAIVLANQERRHIVIRRAGIDAVEGD